MASISSTRCALSACTACFPSRLHAESLRRLSADATVRVLYCRIIENLCLFLNPPVFTTISPCTFMVCLFPCYMSKHSFSISNCDYSFPLSSAPVTHDNIKAKIRSCRVHNTSSFALLEFVSPFNTMAISAAVERCFLFL